MTVAKAAEEKSKQQSKLPLKDWVLLPLLSLITLVVLCVGVERTALVLYPTSETGLQGCFGRGIPWGNAGAIPNTVCSERVAESRELAEYRFNSCGHRAGMECGPKPEGSYRIVMIGSSMAMGLFVPRDETFAATLPVELSSKAGRKIELYNEASGGEFRGGPFPVPTSAQHFDEVLAAHPDMILWAVTPMDIENSSFQGPNAAQMAALQKTVEPTVSKGKIAAFWEKLSNAVSKGSLGENLRYRWDQSRTALVLKHVLYGTESQEQYVDSYLKNEDDVGFLKAEPNAKWLKSMSTFEGEMAEFQQRASAAGVPFVVVLLPNRAQSAMISMGQWPAGYDPYRLGEELRAFVESHGGTYVDVLPDFRQIPNPERHYFPLDGHPDAQGHAVISRVLAKELSSAVPALRAGAQPAAALERRP